MKEHKKQCLICNKEFTPKRSDAQTCSDACRSQKNANARALKMIKPAIVAEVKAEMISEVEQALEKDANADVVKVLKHYETEEYRQRIREIWKLD